MSHEFNNHTFTDCVLSHKVNMKLGLFIVIGLFQLCAPSYGGKKETTKKPPLRLACQQVNWAGLAENSVEKFLPLYLVICK